MSTRTRMAADERRELIVAKAARVFATRPYEEVSTVELASSCGVSRGLLSHYFPTKRDLYLAVVGRLLEGPHLPVPAYVAGATVADRVASSVHAWVGMVAHSPEAWLAVAGILGDSRDADIRTLVDAFVERTADQICEIAGLHEVRDDPRVRISLHGYSAFATAVTRRWLVEEEIGRADLEIVLTSSLLALVGSAEEIRAARTAPSSGR